LPSTETLGQITLGGNFDSTIVSQVGTGISAAATLTAASLTTNAGAVVDFVGLDANLGGSTNKIVFVTAPALTNGILPTGFITEANGATDLAGYAAATGIAAPPYTPLGSATATSNVKLTASTNLAAATSVNAILLDGAVTLGGAFTLTLANA